MSFVLPAKYSEDTPIPKDSTVSIKRLPAKTVAVTVFSGYSSEIVLHIHIADGRGQTHGFTKSSLELYVTVV
jgi:hypothetical protein